jgi:hypothetical protein
MSQRLQRVVAVTRPGTLKIKCQFQIFGGLIQIHYQNFLSGGGGGGADPEAIYNLCLIVKIAKIML